MSDSRDVSPFIALLSANMVDTRPRITAHIRSRFLGLYQGHKALMRRQPLV